MCLDYSQVILYFVVFPIFVLALGTSGLLWLVVRLARHMQSKIDLEMSLKSYE